MKHLKVTDKKNGDRYYFILNEDFNIETIPWLVANYFNRNKSIGQLSYYYPVDGIPEIKGTGEVTVIDAMKFLNGIN